jgi:biopolymer transport protein ExbD
MESVETIGIQQVVGGFLQRRRRGRGRASLGMMPMIDVIFLLLTFFVLTANFRSPEQFLPALVPAANASVTSFNIVEPLVISVVEDGRGCVIRLGGSDGGMESDIVIQDAEPRRGLAVFAKRLGEMMQAQRRTTGDPVELLCGDEVTWDHLVKVYNILYAMGVSDITFGEVE